MIRPDILCRESFKMLGDPDEAQESFVVIWSELLEPISNEDFQELQEEFAEIAA